jgi:hypothetical protein
MASAAAGMRQAIWGPRKWMKSKELSPCPGLPPGRRRIHLLYGLDAETRVAVRGESSWLSFP